MNQQSRRVPKRLTVLTTVIAAYKLRLPAWAVASRASVGVIRASDLGITLGVAIALLLLLQCGSHLADSALLYGGRGVCAQRTQEDEEECGEGGLEMHLGGARQRDERRGTCRRDLPREVRR